ncbi:ATP-dependent DNA helicase UvrD2 [Amycolatopsis keratiniphila]|uniref:ATP-dependent DNA helicase UvrD2 n=1 Tax=Amycolatopsis keratiniphila TaxID=129921 RepID=UPI00087BF871|nr:ATP-dependent DNA helicase UvrD2 [Amycolatopsis keratiniphila]OLZ44476.1 ATP-dependent DNA helicase [Amycolatopsis keratiniphila subsp. nogabecina]SDU47109.1 ATP-dependent DNA helicase, Rep family [Amycolatopsis keratiniphila]
MVSASSPKSRPGLLDGLDPEQRAAACAPRGPVCVLAGAGTGKTRTITHRIAHLVRSGHVAAGQVLAVTFTTRAAGEMRTRLRGLGVDAAQALTFHAAARRQLRYFWPQVVGDRPWELLENKFRYISQAANKAGLGTETELLRDLASEIEWSKASLVSPDDYPAIAARTQRDTPAPASQVAEVYRNYEKVKNAAQVLDFDDLLLHTTAVLEEHTVVAQEFRERYRCFVVDEYQDVTPLQQRLLDAWLGGRDDLTVVGDANQTIYSFGGASPRPLLEFTRRFPEATVVRLERDYRSTPEVVALANQVIGAARGRPAGSRLKLIGQRPSGPVPRFAEYDDETAEAAAVARRIRDLLDSGVAASEIAVLYRVNAQSEAYEQALAEMGIPYLVRGGERFFARAEVRQAMSALRMASTDADTGELVTRVRSVLAKVGLTDQPPAGGAAKERWDALLSIVELAEELASTVDDADLPRFVAELEQRATAQHPPTVEGITLASLHAAKGLEWDAVFLVGLAEGTMPILHADGDEAAIEEERRLFYVGVTRAREHLSLSWALARTSGNRRNRRRSRFLYGLIPEDHPAARVARSQQPKQPGNKARCRVCGGPLPETLDIKLGRCSRCPSNVDEQLLEKLKSWRGERSRELKVPAFVVFTDATLVAIAEQRPTDDTALCAISGIGATKLERFGAEVLDVVRASVES